MTNLKEVLVNVCSSLKGQGVNMGLLADIANQCPIEGGDAVYYARSILENYQNRVEYDDEAICTIAENRSGTKHAYNSMVLPNPSSGLLNTWHGSDASTIEVYNLYGHLIKSYKADGLHLNINLGQEASGIYILKVLDRDNVLLSAHRVILVK
jgi:hypothetical protein